jgi:hypothetical protein
METKTMNPTPLNYSTHAVENLQSMVDGDFNSANDPYIYPERKHNLDNMAAFYTLISEILHDAVKFTLPDNGRLMDPDAESIITSKELELLMLPFPVVALEYSSPGLNDRLISENHASHKRISLAMDFGKAKQKYKDEMVRLMPSINTTVCNEKIAVFSLFHTDESDWQSTLGCTFVGNDSIFEVMQGVDGNKFMRVSGLLPSPLFLLSPEDPLVAFNRLMQDVHNDTVDEVIALVEFCAIMNCSNVDTQVFKASDKLNKKRLISGKFQFYDYHVLMLNPLADKTEAKATGNSSHASPRMHLRRGHIRRLANSKVIWVNATVVGTKKFGVVDKSYQLKT